MTLLLESINNELDELLIEILDTQTQLIEAKLKLELEMNLGFVQIAKTRYIDGSQSVTSLKLPTEMSSPFEPIARVYRSSNDGGTTFSIDRAPSVNNVSLETGELRNRSENEKQPEHKMTFNPIRLFGVLVPQTLKIAQKHFINVVSLITDCANCDSRLKSIMDRYEKLDAFKKKLMSANNTC